MDQQQNSVIQRKKTSVLATNSVIRNTYLLLALTLVFSGFTAYYSMLSNARPNMILFLVGMFGLSFLTQSLRNSHWGLLAIFAFTGFLGYMLGPILHLYMHTYINGGQLVMTALTGTGIIFFVLSAYALITRKDFSYMGGFIAVAFTVAFIGALAGMFFQMPLLQLVISGAFVLLSSAYILFTTSRIINGGETNYIMATMSLFVALFNIFVSLLNILGAFGGRR
jgi:modulator of FtsH protease